MKKIKLYQQIAPLIIVLQFLLMSCANYYKAISIPLKSNVEKAAKIDSLKKANRTFILRNGNNAFLMTNLVLDTEQNKISCTLETLLSYNKLHLTNARKERMRYKKNIPADISVLNEVHVFIAPDSTAVAVSDKYKFSLDNVRRIEVIAKDKQRTSVSYILGGLGITAAILLIAAAIFASTFSLNFGGFGGG